MITQKYGHYYVVIVYRDFSGKKKRKWYKVDGGHREAEKMERHLLTDRDDGVLLQASKDIPVLKEYLTDWLDTSIKPPARSLGTYENYKYCSNKVNAYLGSTRLDRLSPLQISKMYRKMMTDGLSASTVRMIHRMLRAALNKAVKWGTLTKNPATIADIPAMTESPAKAYDHDQALALLRQSEQMDVRYNLIISLGMLCGLRSSESCGLRWQDYKKETGKLYIQHNLCRHNMEGINEKAYEYCRKSGNTWYVLDKVKTKASEATIRLPEYVCDLLNKRKLQYDTFHLKLGPVYHDDNFILSNDVGDPYDNHYIYYVVHKVIEEYNISHPNDPLPIIRAHDLRHTAATLLLESDINIKYVSRQLRHSSTTITQNLYQHVTDKMASITADAMDNLVRSKSDNSSTPLSTPLVKNAHQ